MPIKSSDASPLEQLKTKALATFELGSMQGCTTEKLKELRRQLLLDNHPDKIDTPQHSLDEIEVAFKALSAEAALETERVSFMSRKKKVMIAPYLKWFCEAR